MRAKVLVTACLLVMLSVASAYGQNAIRANVPFDFTVAGKVLPAGQYEFVPGADEQVINVTGKDVKIMAPVFIRLAGGFRANPEDSHVVFDKVKDSYTLSEIWMPRADGFALNILKSKHEHRVLNAPTK